MRDGFNERLALLIEHLGLKKKEFAQQLKIDQSYVSQLTNGSRTPSDMLISLICQKYGVNEVWLRTGEGDMLPPRVETTEEQLGTFFAGVLNGAPDFKRRLISVLARMTPEEWDLLERKARELTKEIKKPDPEGSDQESII